MVDLAILVPSRGRPGNVARLIEACAKTCRTDYRLWFGFDHDDPHLQANLKAAEDHQWNIHEPRMGLGAWTNFLANEVDQTCQNPGHGDGEECGTVPYLASIGDDMVPLTDGWDERLISAAGRGMAYPDDRRRNDVPEAIVMSSGIVEALGWMCLPALNHWFIDTVWADLGNATGSLAYCPDVIVEHRHPNVHRETSGDATYTEAAASYAADLAAWQRWRIRGDGWRADIEKVRGCLS